MTEAITQATTFTLEEIGGITLTLRDRALPYLPLSITGTQRAEFTWYPGSPQATVQMLGPEEGVIAIRGFWKDRFIEGTNAAQVRGASETVLRVSDAQASIRNIEDLVRVVDTMRRQGRLIKLTWDKITRYGHITQFTQTWHRSHDCEWELDFSVTSQEAPVAPVVASAVKTVSDMAAEEQLLVRRLNGAVASTPAALPKGTVPGAPGAPLPRGYQVAQLNILQDALAAYTSAVDAVESAASYLSNGAAMIAAGIALPGNIIRNSMSVVSGVISRLSRAGGLVVDTALTEAFAVGSVLGVVDQDNVPFGIQLGSANYLKIVDRTVREVRSSNAVLRYQMAQQLQDEIAASFVAPQAMDLRDVSTRFYGTPDRWIMLMNYNGRNDSALRAGELIWVPRQGKSSGAGLTQGGRA